MFKSSVVLFAVFGVFMGSLGEAASLTINGNMSNLPGKTSGTLNLVTNFSDATGVMLGGLLLTAQNFQCTANTSPALSVMAGSAPAGGFTGTVDVNGTCVNGTVSNPAQIHFVANFSSKSTFVSGNLTLISGGQTAIVPIYPTKPIFKISQ